VGKVSNDYALRHMDRWRFYSFTVPSIRRENSARKQLNLERDGSNLAQVLLTLKTERPKTFSAIEEVLKLAIPEVEELLTPLTEEGNTYVAIQEKGFAPFDYHQVSDGTLRLLAYITALNLDVDLIYFEEPENFVHPQLLRLLAEILKKSDKQIVLSTHSPYFLDHLEPEDLIIVEKKDGKTNLRRVEAEKQKKEIQNLLRRGYTPRRSLLQRCHIKMKIGLIVEDRYAEAIKEICRKIGITTKIRRQRGRINVRKASSHAKTLLHSCEKVIILPDAYCNPEKERQRVNKVYENIPQELRDRVKVCVVVHELETWLLADEHTLTRYLKHNVKKVTNPEEICDAKNTSNRYSEKQEKPTSLLWRRK